MKEQQGNRTSRRSRRAGPVTSRAMRTGRASPRPAADRRRCAARLYYKRLGCTAVARSTCAWHDACCRSQFIVSHYLHRDMESPMDVNFPRKASASPQQPSSESWRTASAGSRSTDPAIKPSASPIAPKVTPDRYVGSQTRTLTYATSVGTRRTKAKSIERFLSELQENKKSLARDGRSTDLAHAEQETVRTEAASLKSTDPLDRRFQEFG
jgi:hypothetical protein